MVAPHRGHSVFTRGEGCVGTAVRRFFAGDPVGRPCTRLARPRVLPLPPSSLAALHSGPAEGRAARALVAAVAATLDDVPTAMAFGRGTSLGGRATGLRGGTLDVRGIPVGILGRLRMNFDRFEYVPGVRLSGALRQDAVFEPFPWRDDC